MARTPNSEKFELSEDAIGLVTVYANNRGGIIVYLDKRCVDELGCKSVQFKDGKIKIGTIDKEGNTLTPRNGGAVFYHKHDYPTGHYELVNENGHYKMYNLNEH